MRVGFFLVFLLLINPGRFLKEDLKVVQKLRVLKEKMYNRMKELPKLTAEYGSLSKLIRNVFEKMRRIKTSSKPKMFYRVVRK